MVIIIKEDEMGKSCITNGRDRKHLKILDGKSQGKTQSGAPRRRWNDYIGLNGKFLRFRRDGVSINCYTVICLSNFDVYLAIT
jgi:hypothetical protein